MGILFSNTQPADACCNVDDPKYVILNMLFQTSFMWYIQKKQIYGDRNEMIDSLRLQVGMWPNWIFQNEENMLRMDFGDM